MAHIIAITNQKGGVGKTTTAGSLGVALGLAKKKVLCIDLDPQGSLGFNLGVDIEDCVTIYDVLKGTATVHQAVQSLQCCDIIPSNILLSSAELEFNRPGREFMLRTALAPIEKFYDYIIIDTPPALNILTINAYTVANSLLIPMIPDILSLLGISQIKETIDTVKEYYNKDLHLFGILLTKYNSRTRLAREVKEMSEQIAKTLGTKVLPTYIRNSVSVAEAPAHGETVMTYAPKSGPADDYRTLARKIASGKL